MSEETQIYKLSDRPKWWAVRVFKVLSLFTAAFALIALIVIFVFTTFEVFDVMALSGAEESGSELILYFLDEAVWLSLGLLFYALIFWFLSLAIDKLDQLVWLNASQEDRSEILQKRKKKNAKI